VVDLLLFHGNRRTSTYLILLDVTRLGWLGVISTSGGLPTFDGIQSLRVELAQGLLVERKLAVNLLLFHGKGRAMAERCLVLGAVAISICRACIRFVRH
jgi:hypothetical protein